MGLIVNVADFTGRYLLAKNPHNVGTIDDVIDLYEKSYIYKILGVELGDLLIADLTGGVPTSPELLVIFNELAFNPTCNELAFLTDNSTGNEQLFESKGLKNILLGFIYWVIVTEARLQPSQTNGAVQVKVETGTSARNISEIYNRYNDSVKWVKCIQQYIYDHFEDYPTFKGQKILINYSI
jgi:hypothetical protein